MLKCSNRGSLESDLPDTVDAATAYKQMTNLRAIDVSRNAQLCSVPQSWAHLPNLASLNISDCPLFHGLPFGVCALSLIHI